MATQPTGLHLGCGRTILDGWINLDLVAGEGVDVVADLDDCENTPLPLEDNSIDRILGSHLLEHIKNPLPMMDELYRVARPNAEMIFELPYGSSDDAFEDPTHVRQYFLNSFQYFAQPVYWRTVTDYRGDWQPVNILLQVDGNRFPSESDDELLEILRERRNVAIVMKVLFRAIKPARARRRDFVSHPKVEFERTPAVRSTSPVLEHEHMIVNRCRYGLMLSNKNDAYIGRSLQFYGEWCEGEMKLLGQLIQPGNVVIDVGANIGTHTVAFAKKVGRDGRVYSFEPQRVPFQTLCANVALNAFANVITIPKAAGDSVGEIRVPELDHTRPENFGRVSLLEDSDGSLVDVIPIDSLKLTQCNLIKVDVEGMEVNVIRGAEETVRRCHPILLLENNRVEGSKALLTAVFELGYQAYWHFTNYFNPDNFYGQSENIFGRTIEANILCVLGDIPVAKEMQVLDADDTFEIAYRRTQAVDG